MRAKSDSKTVLILGGHARPDAEVLALLQPAVDRLGLSVRAYHRLLKVARTIADLEGCTRVLPVHAAEAIQYRALDRPVV